MEVRELAQRLVIRSELRPRQSDRSKDAGLQGLLGSRSSCRRSVACQRATRTSGRGPSSSPFRTGCWLPPTARERWATSRSTYS